MKVSKVQIFKNEVAVICSYKCLTCSTLNFCLSCDSSTLRVLSYTYGRCLCGTGYYSKLSPIALCSRKYNYEIVCDYRCGDCSNYAYPCKYCAPNRNLIPQYFDTTYKLTVHYCPCNTGYYDDGSSPSCIGIQCKLMQACSYTCATFTICVQLITSSCASCPANQNRYQVNNSCPCNAGYFDDGTQTCKQCSYTCSTCNGASSLSCQSCDPTQFRIQIGNSCPCKNRYFDNGFNVQCFMCSYSCSTCTSPSNQSCLTCLVGSYRAFRGNTCPCIFGHYDDGLSPTCLTCSYTCLTCTAATTSSCKSCSQNQFRIMNGGSCPCQNGYFDDGSSPQCGVCSYTCLNCTGITVFNCLYCPLNSMRKFIDNSCPCLDGYFDNGRSQTCSGIKCFFIRVCSYTCATCTDAQESSCLTCSVRDHRNLYEEDSGMYCLCMKGYQEINNKCEISYEPIQLIRPLCTVFNCIYCYYDICQECNRGYFLNTQQCYPCDERCSLCQGPQATDCITCAFISNEQNQCKLCSEIIGLYTNQNGACVSQCGDGLLYSPNEQCDTGIMSQDEGCSSQCQIIPKLIKSDLNFDATLQPFDNTRTAIVSFQSQYLEADFDQWSFSIPSLPNYNTSQYNLSYNFNKSMNQLQISITFNISVQGQSLLLVSSDYSPLINKNLTAVIPDFTLVDQDVQHLTAGLITFNQFLINLIWIIMVVAWLIGGNEMIWELLDMLQLLSYFQYLNVEYPYNVSLYLKYMSVFNVKYLADNLPYMDNYHSNLSTQYDYGGSIMTPGKFAEDHYVSLFSYNFVGILFGWLFAIFTYYISKFMIWVFASWTNTDFLHEKPGCKRKFYLMKFWISQFVISKFDQFKQNFIYNGMLRVFLASEYDLNLSLMLELNNSHFFSDDYLLAGSSWFALLVLFMKMVVFIFILERVQVHKHEQLNQTKIQRQIGSAVEGFKLKNYGAKYFGVITQVKRFFFMFTLIVFYDNPIFQVAGVMFICLTTSVLYRTMKPFKEKEDFWKSISAESLLFASTTCIFFYAIDKEIWYLDEEKKIFIGWFIIISCMLILLIQVLIDVKLHFRDMVKLWRKFVNIISKTKKTKKKHLQQTKQKKYHIDVKDVVEDLG